MEDGTVSKVHLQESLSKLLQRNRLAGLRYASNQNDRWAEDVAEQAAGQDRSCTDDGVPS